ncbi:hypothetical protein cand_027520 [Cryptosporidium andersoni]|uniref:BRCT domain-containing protein n=1 Tax=Cryptosporidium andersoni TaxID=117008 RepID=A0A1J4MTG7_9CRYT|nr:hypothetical protein cand_027520 [Cryptosporidium andersoni]
MLYTSQNDRKLCVHLIAAQKFLLSCLQLSPGILDSNFNKCFYKQCNESAGTNINCGIPPRNCESPLGFAGIGIKVTDLIPKELRKLLNNIDKKFLDLDNALATKSIPTYRELRIKDQDDLEDLKKIFNNSDKYSVCTLYNSKNSENQLNLCNWLIKQAPIWSCNKEGIRGKSYILTTTPDLKVLLEYESIISCTWGAARVFVVVQFWQTPLSFTERLSNINIENSLENSRNDSFITEFLGGNETTILPLRLLVRFERNISIKNNILSRNFKENETINDYKSADLKQSNKNNKNNTEHLTNKQTDKYYISKDKSNFSTDFINDINNKRYLDNKLNIDNGDNYNAECISNSINNEIKQDTKNNSFGPCIISLVKYSTKCPISDTLNLSNKYSGKSGSCCLTLNSDPNFLSLQIAYNADIVSYIKALIPGRKFDSQNRIWLLPMESIFESVKLVDYLGGEIETQVLLLLLNTFSDGNSKLVDNLHFKDNYEWKKYLPNIASLAWSRKIIIFDCPDISITHSNLVQIRISPFTILDENILNTLRNSKIPLKWDGNIKKWSIPLFKLADTIHILQTSLDFIFVSDNDKSNYTNYYKVINSKIKHYSNNRTIINNDTTQRRLLDINEKKPKKFKEIIHKVNDILDKRDDQSEYLDSDDSQNEPYHSMVITCLGNDDVDSERLRNKIERMIKNIQTLPLNISNLKFIMWPCKLEDWESISFLIVSKPCNINRYHPKLLLALVSNVMVVYETMIDHILEKGYWLDNSFETKYEYTSNIPSMESRLYINEGIFCQTKLYIAGTPDNPDFALCRRLATIGKASFVCEPKLADYIVICDENHPDAINIKRTVPKKKASIVQNTHGETHAMQVTPRWIYDVILDFTILKPTSKRKHKAWVK